mgnify:CR=1 FL=1
MKPFFFLLISLVFVSCTDDINPVKENNPPTFCDCNELILDKDYQRYYLSDKKKPFTGNCITLKPDGKKVFERNYVEGKYHGLVITYHDNGALKSTTEYEKNLMSGDQKLYNLDGKLMSHAIYLRSQLKEIIK